jgi:dTDP-4-amino-4,6-dideoxygalactose transaminase
MILSKKSLDQLAIFGGIPLIPNDLPVGQFYFPKWDEYKKSMEVIFEREYYTNHGPFAMQLEDRLSNFLGVKHVVYSTNATIGLYMVLVAMELKGSVILPSFTFVATAQAVLMAGLTPVFCDIGGKTHHILTDKVEELITEDVSAIVPVNLWGGACNIDEIARLAEKRNLKLIFDSAHGFGSKFGGKRLGGFGDAEIFSFHATKFLSATEGGCIATNDDALADSIRNIRSNYGIKNVVEVPLTINGRISEAQAAIALINFDHMDEYYGHNLEIINVYKSGLEQVNGIVVHDPETVSESNCQSAVITVDSNEFGLTRDQLLKILQTENIHARRYFYPGVHKMIPFDEFCKPSFTLDNTDRLCKDILQLPIGAMVTAQVADSIVGLIKFIQTNSEQVGSFFNK